MFLLQGDVRVRNLWDLVYILQGHTDISLLSPNYTQSIMHHSHIIKCSLVSNICIHRIIYACLIKGTVYTTDLEKK